MHPAYFETRFCTPAPVTDWPSQFVIVTAFATTGTTRSAEENERADRELEADLRERAGTALEAGRAGRGGAGWLQRITGYSPSTGHAEPGWAVDLPFEEACDLGLRFRQDAIYVVRGDDLFVTHCDERRGEVRVGRFRERLDTEGCPDGRRGR